MSGVYTSPPNERISNLDEYANKLYYNAEFFIAINVNILGFIAFYANDRKTMVSYITQIAVKEEFQNQNIGKTLLGLCVEVSTIFGMKYIKLEVYKNNNKAIRFYRKNGFRFYGEASSKSIYMVRNL